METENWYLQNKPRIMRQVRFFLRPYRKHLTEAYGKTEGEAIARDGLGRSEALLPGLPDIGGGENPQTKALCSTMPMLAIYQALRERGAPVEEAARLVYLGAASFCDSLPTRWLMRWQGKRLLGRKSLDRWRRAAAISQERRYPEDSVFEVIEGDGHDFEFGVDYTECGIVKYLSREGAPELAPYVCWVDFCWFAAMRLRLDRTETIAQGGQRCDFRLSRREPVEVEPEFLHV